MKRVKISDIDFRAPSPGSTVESYDTPMLFIIYLALENDPKARAFLDMVGIVVVDYDGNQIYPPIPKAQK